MAKIKFDEDDPMALMAQITKLAGGKLPKKVTLSAAGNGFSTNVEIGSKKTTIVGIRIEKGCVLVTFKDKVWGNTTHQASSSDGKIFFWLPDAPGRGELPKFTLSF